MKVFLSWAGEASKSIAREFNDWLPKISENIEPFFSEKDITLGNRWSDELKKGLQEANYGIIFFTPGSLDSGWIIWEAGNLSGKLGSKVCGLAFNVSIDDLPEQVKQFQNTEYSKNGVSKLLESLNKELKDKTLKKQLKAVLEYNWPSLDGKIQEIIPSKKKQPIPKKREDMQVQEAINDSLNTQKTQKKVNRMSRSLQLLALSIETPAYFLDKTFRITYANLSTALIFGIFINKAKGKLISDIIEQKKDEILNYDEVMQHLAETFSDPQNMPPYDFELIKFKHKKYGNINLEKIALAVRDPDRQLEIESWVIAFNITSIDKLETYYSDLKGAITNYFQFEEQRQW